MASGVGLRAYNPSSVDHCVFCLPTYYSSHCRHYIGRQLADNNLLITFLEDYGILYIMDN